MRKGRCAVCANATRESEERARTRSARFISSLHERPAADVEILGHGHVHEAARVAQRPRDVAFAAQVLGEDEVARPANEAAAFASLELEDARSEEDELPPRSVVEILHVALGCLAEKERAAPEGLRHGPLGAAQRHLADLDRRVSRVPGEYPDDAHAETSLF